MRRETLHTEDVGKPRYLLRVSCEQPFVAAWLPMSVVIQFAQAYANAVTNAI